MDEVQKPSISELGSFVRTEVKEETEVAGRT
jgi:hypothetical protein